MEGAQIGPYRVLGDLGSGGMGRVYLAEVVGRVPGLDDGSRVALKVKGVSVGKVAQCFMDGDTGSSPSPPRRAAVPQRG